MSELRARFFRDADQVERLMRKRGRKWARINKVRSRQRRCYAAMLQKPTNEQTRAMQRLKPYVRTTEDELREFEKGEGHHIYVQAHVKLRQAY